MRLVSREELAEAAKRYGGGQGKKAAKVFNLDGSMAKPGEPWKVKDVQVWLGEIGLGQYSQAFESRKIDGLALIKLQPADLQRVGIQPSSDDARKLLEEITKLNAKVCLGEKKQ